MPRTQRGIWAGFDGTQKPGPGWAADPDHPLRPSFALLADEGAGGGMLDVVGGMVGKGTTGLTWPNGVASLAPASSGRLDFTRPALTQKWFTISALVNVRTDPGGSGAGNGIFYQGTGSAAFGTQFGIGFLGTGMLFFGFGGASNVTSSSGLWSTGTPTRLGVTYNAGAYQFWVGGVGKDSGTTATGSVNLDNAHVGYWYDSTATVRYLDALLLDLMVFDGTALDARQWAEHAARPYDWLMMPGSRRAAPRPSRGRGRGRRAA
jgi:hypothetical protein